jgi:hypothetical protein
VDISLAIMCKTVFFICMAITETYTNIYGALMGNPLPLALQGLNLACDKKWEEWQQNRNQEANNQLLHELKNANINVIDLMQKYPDHVFSSISRYEKAVRDGVALSNLLIMAKIIRGCFVENEETNDINSDKCVYLQSIAAELSIAEMKLLYLLYQETKYSTTRIAASATLKDKIIPTLYPDKDYYDSAIARLLRTGLITPLNTAGGMTYQTSPLMQELIDLATEEEWQKSF